MHPIDHAVGSVAKFGGTPLDYLELHRYFDATKIALAHFSHRALRHHQEGVSEAANVFGEEITRLSDGLPVSVEALGRQHCEEDCGGRLPKAADWIDRIVAPDWTPVLSSIPTAEALAEASVRRFGGVVEAYLPLHEWFLATTEWGHDMDARHLAMRHHSFGIFEAEERFGVAFDAGLGVLAPVRYVAERHCRAVLGRIPSVSDWLRRLRPERWMTQVVKPVHTKCVTLDAA